MAPKPEDNNGSKDSEKLPAKSPQGKDEADAKRASKEDKRKAAQKSAENDAMLREVDEAVRQDQLADFGQRYGRPILGLIVAGLLAFGGYLWWDHVQEGNKEADSEQIIKAEDSFQAGNAAEGEKTLGDLPDNAHSDGARSSAKMLKAGAKVEQGKPKEAAKLFAQIADDADAPQEMRDLARIRQVALSFDTMKPAEVEARLKPLAVPGNPYFGSAGELVAMAMLEQGKKKEAGTLLGEIAKNEDVPDSIRSRSRQMAGLLGVDSIPDADKFVEEQAAASAAAGPAGPAPGPAAQ